MNVVASADTVQFSDKHVACFGRFMIDVPPEAEVGYADVEYMFGLIHTERQKLNAGQFAERIETREQEIKKGKDTGQYRYVRTQHVSKPVSAALFLSDMQGLISGKLYRFEMVALADDVLFSVANNPYGADKIDSIISQLQTSLLPRLRARAPDEIPTEPGLCIRDGFIASDGSEQANERINIGLHFKRWPDLALSITTWTIHKAEPSLLERMNRDPVPDIFKPLISQIKTVREGRHDVGALAGEESMEMMPTGKGYKVHRFSWESHFELSAPFKPMITVTLNTGRSPNGDQRPMISEKEAVELFDAVVNSIRLRPTGPARTSEVPSPKTPLGAFIRSGEPCPHTGWWQCPDGGELEGGNRRFLRAGEAMPRAVTLGAPSLLQRLSGERPRHEAPTVWKLVAYAEEKGATPGPLSNPSAPEGSTEA